MIERSRIASKMTMKKVQPHVPSWTAKDFDAIARIIAGFSTRPSKEAVMEEFAVYCEKTNPGFNRDLFLAVCRGER